jgi:hypothetical protein
MMDQLAWRLEAKPALSLYDFGGATRDEFLNDSTDTEYLLGGTANFGIY